jgi:hypothetical protein
MSYFIIMKKCLVDRHWRSCFSTIHGLWCMLLVLLFTFCRTTLSDCPAFFSRYLPLSFLPLILPVVTIFSNFPFLKMCPMNRDCFFLNSFIVFLFSLTCFRMFSLVILSVHGTFSIRLQNHISVVMEIKGEERSLE